MGMGLPQKVSSVLFYAHQNYLFYYLADIISMHAVDSNTMYNMICGIKIIFLIFFAFYMYPVTALQRGITSQKIERK
jgi:hypothetical protein